MTQQEFHKAVRALQSAYDDGPKSVSAEELIRPDSLNGYVREAMQSALVRDKTSVDALKDALQHAANNGAFICPLAGKASKPEMHSDYCLACRVREMLTPGWYVVPETEMRACLFRHAAQFRER